MINLSEFEFVEKHFGGHKYRLSLRKIDSKEEVGFVIVDLQGDFNRFGEYCIGKKLAHIIRLETAYSYTKQGIAHAVLDRLFSKYKDWNFSLFVYPTFRGENDFNMNDLRKWYKQFGFVKTKELIYTMVRKPK